MATKTHRITDITESLNTAACILRGCNKKKVGQFFGGEKPGSSSEKYKDPNKAYSLHGAGGGSPAASKFNSEKHGESAVIISSYSKKQQKKIDKKVATIVSSNDRKTFNAELIAEKKRENKIKAKKIANEKRQAIKKAELAKKEAAQKIIDRDNEIKKEVADRRKRINREKENELKRKNEIATSPSKKDIEKAKKLKQKEREEAKKLKDKILAEKKAAKNKVEKDKAYELRKTRKDLKKEIEPNKKSYKEYKKLPLREKKAHPIYKNKLILLKGILTKLKKTYGMTDEKIRAISKKSEGLNSIDYDFFIKNGKPTPDNLDDYLKAFRKILADKQKKLKK